MLDDADAFADRLSAGRAALAAGAWEGARDRFRAALAVCDGDGRSTRQTLHALARASDVPWQLAIGADLAVPEVEGPRPPRLRIVNGYVSRLQAAAAHDPALSRAFVRVTGLVDRPEALLRPSIARRVMRPRALTAD